MNIFDIYLDNINEISLSFQAHLLNLLRNIFSKIENDNKNSILIDLNNINRIKKILGGIKNNNEK